MYLFSYIPDNKHIIVLYVTLACIALNLKLDPDLKYGLMTRVQVCVTDRWTGTLKMCVINSHTEPSQGQK